MTQLSKITDREFGRMLDQEMDRRLDEYLDPIPVSNILDFEPEPEPDCREDCREFAIRW